MKMKRMVLWMCILVLTLGIMVSSAVPAKAQADAFYVGFARVDINPYVVDGDLSSGMMELPLRGVGDTWNRLSKPQLLDDNGDGKIDKNDGLSATCIAISDSSGNTVLMITIDLIGGDRAGPVKTEIISRVEAALASGELSNVKLTADQIYYAGTHTHNAPDISVYSAAGKTGFNNDGKDLSIVNKNLGIWLDRTVKSLGDAAIRALKDRSEATLTKYAIAASEDSKPPVSCKVMNTVRHYYNYDPKGNIVCVAGDNFNNRGSNPKPVTPVDDTLYMMYFDFAAHNQKTGENKLPIVVANWRGHPSLNNSDSSYYGDRKAISSDYVNAFCHALEYNCTVDNTGKGYYSAKQVYRVAFFQGAGGNVNPRSGQVIGGVLAGKWLDDMSTSNKECRGNGYGRILCALAKHGLNTVGETVTPGPIKTMAYSLCTGRKTFGITALAYEAGVAFQENPDVALPFAYTNEEGQTYVIGSRFHASAVVSRWDPSLQKNVDSPTTMALNTIMIGDGLAMVTVPGEPFDYYFNENDTNAWDNLISDTTYGKPWILSLCNGCSGYVPNNKAYTYNAGSTEWTTGSYESHTTSYDIGTGELMVETFSQMLGAMAAGTHEGYRAHCVHCDREVSWEPYRNQTTLTTGHYYMLMDAYVEQIRIEPNGQVCFDLNGHTIKGSTRVFYTQAKGKSVLSIMDSSQEQTGRALGAGGQLGAAVGFGGGALIVDSTNTVNLYGGTIGMFEKQLYSLWRGGVIHVSGTFNMYGGQVLGGEVASFSGAYLNGSKVEEKNRTGIGATIFSSGNLNLYGGRIHAGTVCNIVGTVQTNAKGVNVYDQTVTQAKQVGHCVYSSGKVTVAGDAVVDDICYADGSAKTFTVDTAKMPFTGSVQLSYVEPLTSTAVGKCADGAALRQGSVRLSGGDVSVIAQNGVLYALGEAMAVAADGSCYYYTHLADALNAAAEAPGACYLRLMADIPTGVSVKADTLLDLSGYSVSGDIAVANGAVLYCMDSATDDAEAAECGVLSGTIHGTVKAKPMNMPGEGQGVNLFDGMYYHMLSQSDGLRFCRVTAQLTQVSLRPSVAGIYYTAEFEANPLITAQIVEFGIVINAYRDPHQEASLTEGSNLCVRYAADALEQNAYTSALVTGIMKQSNTDPVNAQNAARAVYACTYVKFTDGSCCYGQTAAVSLQQLMETADELDLIQGSALDAAFSMYEKYADVMKDWRIPRLRYLLEN